MKAHQGLTRREAVVAGAGAGVSLAALTTPAFARRRAAKPEVAVLGGGMAGLTAAHELIERGFAVTVYERKAWVARHAASTSPSTAAGGRKPLPGEHGFRFFPGFYHHVPDSMRRIPFPGNANGVWDNLAEASGGKWLRAGDRPDGVRLRHRPRPATGLQRRRPAPQSCSTCSTSATSRPTSSPTSSNACSSSSRAPTSGASASGNTCPGGTS